MDKKTIKCVECGETFTKTGKRTICSPECRRNRDMKRKREKRLERLKEKWGDNYELYLEAEAIKAEYATARALGLV